MDKSDLRIVNATQDADDRTISQTDYTTPEPYAINGTDNTVTTKNWGMLGVLPIVAFVATGNILVILAVKLDHKLRSSTNYFLTSLAVADLLVAITVMPPSLVMIINNYVWPFGDHICGIWVMLDVCFSTASILHLCTISLDRYWALARPFQHRSIGWASNNSSVGGRNGNTRFRSGSGFSSSGKIANRVTRRIILVWGVSLGISLPLPIMGYQNRKYIFDGQMCVINVPEFTIYGSLVAFFLPLVVMFVTYSLTIRTLQKQSKMVKMIMGNEGAGSHWRRSSRSGSLSSGQSFKQTRSSVTSAKDGSAKNLSTSTFEALPDIVCTSTETKPVADCNANTNENGIALAGNDLSRTLPRSLSDTTECNSKSAGRSTLHKSESDASDTSITSNQQTGFGRSPMLARANIKLSKVVSRFPLSRVSTRRISASARSRVIATEQRASKVLGMIFTLFCLFWCPFFITNAFSGMCSCYNLQCNAELMGNLMNWFVWVGYVSSGVNPCVYTLFSRQFRETFKKLICFRCSEIPHSHRRQYRRHNFDCGAGSSNASSFRRDYSYRKYDASRHAGTLENGGRYASPLSEQDEFENADFRSSVYVQEDEMELDDLNKSPHHNTQKPANYLQWRSTWHSSRYEDTLSALKSTRSVRVTFRETLQQHRRRKPLLQESDTSSNEKLQDSKARSTETL